MKGLMIKASVLTFGVVILAESIAKSSVQSIGGPLVFTDGAYQAIDRVGGGSFLASSKLDAPGSSSITYSLTQIPRTHVGDSELAGALVQITGCAADQPLRVMEEEEGFTSVVPALCEKQQEVADLLRRVQETEALPGERSKSDVITCLDERRRTYGALDPLTRALGG